MKSMAHVWMLTLLGAVLGMTAWWVFWSSEGTQVQSGEASDLVKGFATLVTLGGDAMWLPWVLGATAGAIICFVFGKSNLRKQQELEQRQAAVAAVPHPMD